MPGLTLPGYGTGGYGVQLDVTAIGTLTPVRTFATPLTLRSRRAPAASRPSTRRTGRSGGASRSSRRPRSHPARAPPGLASEDGGFVIQTTVAGSFALVPDRIPPTPPADVSARFVGDELALAWNASTDRNGPIAGTASR